MPINLAPQPKRLLFIWGLSIGLIIFALAVLLLNGASSSSYPISIQSALYCIIAIVILFIICYLFLRRLTSLLTTFLTSSTNSQQSDNRLELFFPNSIAQLPSAITFHLNQLSHENHRLSSELDRLEQEYRSILDTQSEIVFLVGEDGFITYKNKAFDLFFEHPAVKINDNNLDGFSRKISLLMEELMPYLEAAKSTNQDQLHTTNTYSNGSIRFINWRIKQQTEQNAPLFLLVGRDETTSILLREKNEKLGKITTVGRAASTIFHEINQPLSIIQLSTSLIQDINSDRETADNKASPEVIKHTDIILSQINRVTQIVKNLRLFHSGDQSKIQTELFKPDRIIKKSATYLETELASNDISLSFAANATDAKIEGNPDLFSQVIINIIQNSIHALASSSDGNDNRISITSETYGNDIFICISNNGECIPHNILDKILEPFFTTKSVGSGSGLGLSLCLDIITKMKGTLKVVNLAPQGVKTTITIPLCPQSQEE